MSKMEPTKVADIRDRLMPVVDLPGWEGHPFRARLRKVSLLSMVQAGHLPNELLAITYKIVKSGGSFNPVTQAESPEEFSRFVGLLHAIAKEALVEPTYDEVKDLLTDDQLSAIFIYSMRGLKALELFRRQRDVAEAPGIHSEGVRGKAK